MIVKRRKKSDNEDADIGFNYSDDISDDLYGIKSQDDNTKQEIKESEEKNQTFYGYGYCEGKDGYDRTSKYLVEAVEKLGTSVASGSMACLEVVEIPDDISYEIDEYDGIETIHETHRSW